MELFFIYKHKYVNIIFFSVMLVSVVLFEGFCCAEALDDSLTQIIKNVREEEKTFSRERLSYIHSKSYFVDLVMKNHNLLWHDKESSKLKKVGFTALNVVAAPVAFGVDAVIGPLSKDIIGGVDRAVKNPEISARRKALTIALSVPSILVAIPLGYLYRVLFQLPALISSGVTYSGFSFNDFRRTSILLKSLRNGNRDNFLLKRLSKKASMPGQVLTQEQTANALLKGLDPRSKDFQAYIEYLNGDKGLKADRHSDKQGTVWLEPDVAIRAGTPIGLNQMAMLVKVALGKSLIKGIQ